MSIHASSLDFLGVPPSMLPMPVFPGLADLVPPAPATKPTDPPWNVAPHVPVVVKVMVPQDDTPYTPPTSTTPRLKVSTPSAEALKQSVESRLDRIEARVQQDEVKLKEALVQTAVLTRAIDAKPTLVTTASKAPPPPATPATKPTLKTVPVTKAKPAADKPNPPAVTPTVSTSRKETSMSSATTDTKAPVAPSEETTALGARIVAGVNYNAQGVGTVADEALYTKELEAATGVTAETLTKIDTFNTHFAASGLYGNGLRGNELIAQNPELTDVTLRVPTVGRNAFEFKIQRERTVPDHGSNGTKLAYGTASVKYDMYATGNRGEVSRVKSFLSAAAAEQYGKK